MLFNSCYANMDDKQKVQEEQFVLINQLDAKIEVSNGDKVKVFNDRGSFNGVVK